MRSLLCVLACFACLFPGTIMAQSGEKTELLKHLLLSREQQVASFSADYTLSQNGLTKSDFTWKEDQRHSLQFMDELYLWNRKYVRDKEGSISTTYSNYDGIITSFQTGDYAPNDQGASGIVGREKNPVPEGAYLDPRMVTFGYFDKESLESRFASARLLFWVSSEGLDVLSCVEEKNKYTRNDFYLDSNLRLVKIAHGRALPQVDIEKHPQLYLGIEERDLFSVSWIIDMSDFIEIDGVPIPLKAVKRWVSPRDLPKGDSNIDGALALKMVFTDKDPVVDIQQTMLMDRDSIKVNPTLDKEDFKIVFPVGTMVVDKIAGLSYDVGTTAEIGLDQIIAQAKLDLDYPVATSTSSTSQDRTSKPLLPQPTDDSATRSKESAPPISLTVVRSETSRIYWVLASIALFAGVLALLLRRRREH